MRGEYGRTAFVRQRCRRVAVVLATGVVSAALVGCGGSSGTSNSSASSGGSAGGGGGKTVTIGASGPRTGPNVGVWPIWEAQEACIKNANANGGVNGYTFDYKVLDDQYDPALTASATRKLVDQENVLALVGHSGTAGTVAIKDYLVSKGVPDIAHHSSSPEAGSPVTYSLEQGGPNAGAFQVHFLASKGLAKSGIGLMYEDDALGQPVLEGVKYQAGQDHTKLTSVGFQLASRDLTPQVSRLKASGADAVIISAVPQAFPTIIRAADSIGYHPKWLAVAYAAIPDVLKQLPDDQKENMYFSWYAAFPGAKGTDDMVAAMHKYFPKSTPSALWSEGWAACTIFLDGFKRMTDSGAQPSREALLKAMNGIQDFSNSYVHGISYKAGSGIKQPHLVRPNGVVGKWDTKDQAVKVVQDFTEVPKVPGWPGQ